MEKASEFNEKLKKSDNLNKEDRISKQKEAGKLLARERINLLLDKNSFEEFGEWVTHRCNFFGMENKKEPGDGVITGFGTIDGRPVGVFANDFTVFGGSVSEMNAKKICYIMDRCMEMGIPIIGINDSGGARIQEGVLSLAGYADIFYRNTILSGYVPQISIIAGPCAGGAVYSPALTDFIIMINKISYMFVTGPNVVKSVTGEDVDVQSLGGGEIHATKSGVASLLYNTEEEAYKETRRLLSFLPLSCKEQPPANPYTPMDEERPLLNEIIPQDQSKTYNVIDVIKQIVDDNTFFEIQPQYAKNLVIGFGRIGGRSVGIVANNSKFFAGALDINSSRKGARFVRFCDAFNIPLVVLVDVPGFMPGTYQEWNGIIIHGSKLLYAFCEATVPRITVILRKAYGGAYDVMNSYHIGGDVVYATPISEIAVMGPAGATEILFKKEIVSSPNPKEKLKELEKEYVKLFCNPYYTASLGFVHKIIQPSEIRKYILFSLEMLKNKTKVSLPKKHGNIPL